MELRRYLAILRRGWWLALPAFLATAAVTVAMVLPQPTIYESTSTYVVRPRSVDTSTSLRAFDTLTRGVEINATYATIARSDLIRDRATARLGPSASIGGITTNADVITGTNLLFISARGHDPGVVHDLTAALGAETIAYIDSLQDSYRLEPLDPATTSQPVGPNRPLIITTGLILGAALGGGLAIGREYLRSPPHIRPAAAPAQFSSLRHQLQRARRDHEPFSFGLVRLTSGNALANHSTPDQTTEELKGTAQALQERLGRDTAIAPLGGDTYAVMLPGLTAPQAEDRLAHELAAASAHTPAPTHTTPRTSIAMCELRQNRFIGDATAALIADQLTTSTTPLHLTPTETAPA